MPAADDYDVELVHVAALVRMRRAVKAVYVSRGTFVMSVSGGDRVSRETLLADAKATEQGVEHVFGAGAPHKRIECAAGKA